MRKCFAHCFNNLFRTICVVCGCVLLTFSAHAACYQLTLSTNAPAGATISSSGTTTLYRGNNTGPYYIYTDSSCTTKYTGTTAKPTISGYTFLGYFETQKSVVSSDASDGSLAWIDYTGAATNYGHTGGSMSSAKTLYAAWAKNCSSVSNGSCSLTPNSTNYRADYNTSCNTGYTLTSGADAYNPECTQNDKIVTLDKQGGSGGTSTIYKGSTTRYYTTPTCTSSGCVIGYSGSTTNTSVSSPTKTGYTFGGYYTGTNGTGTKVIDENGQHIQTSGVPTNTTLYAKWKLDAYIVTLNFQEGTSSTTTIYEKPGSGWYRDENMSQQMKPSGQNCFSTSRSGYTFGGYFTGTNGTGTQIIASNGCLSATAYNNSGIFNSDATIYAKWTPNVYEVELDFQGGFGESATRYVYEKYGINWYLDPNATQAMSSDGTNHVTIPTRTGYTFKGYYTAPTGGDQAIQSNGVKRSGFNSGLFTDDNGKFYAHWTQNTYTVKYNANGGEGTTSSSNHTYDVAQTLTQNGFTNGTKTFLGWSASSIATVVNYTDKQSVSNLTSKNGETVTLYAVWGNCQACSAGTGANCTLSVVNNVCTYTTSCPAGYTINGNGTATPTCTANTITCSAGKYLPANTTTCSECPANSYCGGGSYTFSESNSQGRTSCPSGFGLSPAGSVFQSECYRQCTSADVAHSKSTGTFTGKFYSNETNACEPVNDASCADGYHYKAGSTGLDVDASIGGVGHGYQNDSTGRNGANSDATEKYGITEDQTWAVEFSYGVVRGKALCSTTEGERPTTGTPDESTGKGQYCWCQIDGFTPTGGSKQSLSGAWVFLNDLTEVFWCADSCASRCGLDSRYMGLFRAALLGSVEGGIKLPASPAICEANDITIDWGNDSPTSCKYDGDIKTPETGVEKTGYTFKGWKFNKDK